MKIRITSLLCLLFAGALCLGAAMQAEQSKTSGKKQWNQKNAVTAFNMALTRSGYDRTFRDLLGASLESAKQAVSDEGQIIIPNDVAVLFHEDKKEQREKHHAFWLPPLDEKARTAHEYKQHFECCYDVW